MHLGSSAALAAILPCIAAGAWAQAPDVHPAGRPSIALVGAAFDQDRRRLVIVGGAGADSVTAQTWEWDGRAWRDRTAAGPSPRDEPMLIYDSARQRTLLHGGSQGATAANDTWAWDGGRWQRLATAGPSPRLGATLAYDAGRGRVLLFGGSEAGTGQLHNDLWAWEGTAWRQLLADDQPGSPPARALHGLAYDAGRDRLLVAGGFTMDNGRPTPLGDAWEWDGGAWRRTTLDGPGPRDHLALVYDATRGGVLLHGGGRPAAGLLGDTWLYNGKAWTRVAENGPPRGRHRLVQGDQGAILLYGGWGPQRLMAELWTLRSADWMMMAPPDTALEQ